MTEGIYPLSTLRQPMIDLRDEAFESAVMLSHVIAWMSEYATLSTLRDYVPTIEKTGSSLNYGHSVIRQMETVLKLS